MSRSAISLVAVLLSLVVACTSVPPSPTVVPTSAASPGPSARPSSSPSATATPELLPPPKVVGSLELEACDPAGELPCESQSVVLSRAIVGTGVALSFSTEWARGRLDRPEWEAAGLGLGGWSLDVLQHYDPEHEVLLAGDGSWRIVPAFDLDDGEHAVPSFDGRQVFVFDASWHHVRTLDDITGATLLTFSYDPDGRLTGAEGSLDSDPVHLSVTRNPDGSSMRLIGLAGAESLVSVDERGNLVSLASATGAALQIDPGSWGLIDSWQSVAGQKTTYMYDTAGRLASSTDADGVATRFDRTDTADGFEVHVTTALDRVSTVRHQARAGTAVRSVTGPGGVTTRLEIAPDGSRTVAYPDGTLVSVGNRPHPRWGAAAGIPTPYVERRPDGSEYRQEIGAIVPTGPGEEPYGRPWQKDVVVDGQRWVQSFEPGLRMLTWTDPSGREASYTFDEAGRIIERIRPGERSEAYAYDGDGRLQSVTQGSTTRVTTFAHDPETGEVRVTRPDGLVEAYLYDRDGLIVRSTAPDGSAVGSMYDADAHLVQVRYGDHPSTTLGYSPAGRPTAYLPPVVAGDSSYELRTYDDEGRIATTVGPGDRSVAFAYDSVGRLAAWRFDRGEVAAEYDPATGDLVRLVAPGSVATTLEYAGQPVSIAWSGPVAGDVTVTLDAAGRLSDEAVNGEDRIAYARDGAGYLVTVDDLSLEVGNEGLPTSSAMGIVNTAWSYDADSQLTDVVTTAGDKAIQRLHYEYDALGRISAIEQTGPDGVADRTDYRFDAADRLASVTLNGADVETYAYDAAGNRISVTRAGGTATASYDDRDRLLSWDTATYEYAGDGTLATRREADGSTVYDYDDLGALRSATLADGRHVEYVVDGSGRRIGRMVDGKLVAGYLYRPVRGLVVAETDGNGAVVARFAYDDDDRLVSMRRDGRSYRIVTDQLGSPVLVVDVQSGAVAQQVVYDAWGVVVADSNPGFTPFGFAGGLQDPDTGLAHFEARDYDPVTGRWTGPDPIRFEGGDPNLYRYVWNDPVDYADPSGLKGPRKLPQGSGKDPMNGKPCNPGWTGYGCSVSPDENGKWPKQPTTPPKKDDAPYDPANGRPCNAGQTGYGCSVPPDETGEKPAYWPPLPPAQPPSAPTTPTGTPPATTPTTPTGSGGGGKAPGGGGRGFCVGICWTPGGGLCIGFCSFGEPHLRTGDGRAFDFQSAGEFTVSRSPDGATLLQARQQTPTGSTTVTLTRAVAMLVAGDRVGIYADKERPLIINGEIQARNDVGVRLAGGGVVERHGSEFTVDWPDGSRLLVHVYSSFLNYDFAPSDALAPALVGVLGSRDGTVSNDLTTSAGVVLDPNDPAFFDRLHHEFADSWRITQAESLFDYLPGETTDTFTRREIPTARATVADIAGGARQSAEALCRALGVTSEPTLFACILDVGLTGDPSFAGSAASVAAATAGSTRQLATDVVEISIGSLTTGELKDPSEVDRHRFTASAGQVVYLDAQGDCVEGLFWRLLHPDGSLLDFQRTCVDIGRKVLPEAGDWIIEVYSDATAVGSFGFTILAVPAATQSDVAVGGAVTGAVEAIGAWHGYRFTAGAGEVVYLDAQGDCVEGLFWRLVRPDGTMFDFERTCVDIAREVLPDAGDWIIEVYSDTTAVGSFAFTLLPVPPVTQSDVAVGGAVSGEVEAIGAWHRHRFTASAGQVVYLDAQGDCVEGLFWRLVRPDGSLLDFQRTCVDIAREVLPEAGDWIIEVYSDTTAVGSFAFTLLPVPPVTQSDVAVGGVVTGAVEAIGAWHRYRFTASAGQVVYLDAQGDCVEGLFWRLVRPSDTMFDFQRTCVDIGPKVLPEAGDWIIEVYSDTTALGSFAFTLKPDG